MNDIICDFDGCYSVNSKEMAENQRQQGSNVAEKLKPVIALQR